MERSPRSWATVVKTNCYKDEGRKVKRKRAVSHMTSTDIEFHGSTERNQSYRVRRPLQNDMMPYEASYRTSHKYYQNILNSFTGSNIDINKEYLERALEKKLGNLKYQAPRSSKRGPIKILRLDMNDDKENCRVSSTLSVNANKDYDTSFLEAYQPPSKVSPFKKKDIGYCAAAKYIPVVEGDRKLLQYRPMNVRNKLRS